MEANQGLQRMDLPADGYRPPARGPTSAATATDTGWKGSGTSAPFRFQGRRDCSGELVSEVKADTRWARIEVRRRRTDGNASTQFRQAWPVLYWCRRGVNRAHLNFGGHTVGVDLHSRGNLLLCPANCEVTAEFETATYTDYVCVFLEPGLVRDSLGYEFDRPLVGFDHERLRRGLADLCHEASTPDGVFNLHAEGWTIQALAYLARLYSPRLTLRAQSRGGLPAGSLRRVQDLVRANLSGTISLVQLSAAADLSPRQFLRAFRESIGDTPLRYVQAVRIEEAKRLLVDSRRSITDIALDCGFSHAQHFTTSFHKYVGITPSAYRRSRLL
jgi:AraC family transcriptional regulator